MAEEIGILDKFDRAIIWHLDVDSRKSYSKIASAVRLSKQAVKYRINKMEKAGFIRGYRMIANLSSLGYMYCRLHIKFHNTAQEQEKKMIEAFAIDDRINWIVRTDGPYDLLVGLLGKNEMELDQTISDILSPHKDWISSYDFAIVVRILLYNRGYWLGKKSPERKYMVGNEKLHIKQEPERLDAADKKILLGKEVTKGMGAGADPKKGEAAAREAEHDIKQALTHADMVFITCGLGGGTGTGSVPVIADIAKKLGALTVAVVTIPFTMEGRRRYENAVEGLERLETVVDTLIVIPNDKLLELAPDLPLQTAFKVADEILTNAVKGIAELVTKTGLINLDFADIKAVMSNGGVALIGVGESDTENRAVEAVEKAITNPLLDVDISGANGALINVIGGPDMTLEEAKKVVEVVSAKLDEDARIIWGAQIYEDLERTMRAMLIVTGVKSSQILGHGQNRLKGEHRKEIENELGIEFLD